MKSVLEFVGAYLYIACRVIEIPVLGFLYLLFALVITVRSFIQLKKMATKATRRSFHRLQELTKQAFEYGQKLQSWALHK